MLEQVEPRSTTELTFEVSESGKGEDEDVGGRRRRVARGVRSTLKKEPEAGCSVLASSPLKQAACHRQLATEPLSATLAGALGWSAAFQASVCKVHLKGRVA